MGSRNRKPLPPVLPAPLLRLAAALLEIAKNEGPPAAEAGGGSDGEGNPQLSEVPRDG